MPKSSKPARRAQTKPVASPSASSPRAQNRYGTIIEKVFADGYKGNGASFTFSRAELDSVADELGIERVKNLGDLVYSFRYRVDLPESIRKTATKGREWLIQGAGKSVYKFELGVINKIEPRTQLVTIKIPDATPEIIGAYALNDEQALLAKVRYNRLIDVFLGVTAFSLQNHLRTTVAGVGQIEIDEIYIAVDRYGRQFVIPVQAKGGNDRHGAVQTQQDIAYCSAQKKLKHLICRAVSAQFLAKDHIAMFELTVVGGAVKVVDEKHYQLVPASSITADDLAAYGIHGGP
ncbi:MAG: hypothetical protein O9341_24560 [Paucibacter sp.]|nr:hypothetical protein [Roseateles sp.]